MPTDKNIIDALLTPDFRERLEALRTDILKRAGWRRVWLVRFVDAWEKSNEEEFTSLDEALESVIVLTEYSARVTLTSHMALRL
jgi:hypothetical protein